MSKVGENMYLLRDVYNELFGLVRGRREHLVTAEDSNYYYVDNNGVSAWIEKDLMVEPFNSGWINPDNPIESFEKFMDKTQPADFLKAYEELTGLSKESMYTPDIEKSKELEKYYEKSEGKTVQEESIKSDQRPFFL